MANHEFKTGSARLNDLLDKLGEDTGGTSVSASASGRARQRSFSGAVRPVTNILRDPEAVFGAGAGPGAGAAYGWPPQQGYARTEAPVTPGGYPPAAPPLQPAPYPTAYPPVIEPISEPGYHQAATAGAPAAAAHVNRRGEIIAVFAARGGVGATTLAINTAAALATRGNEVCLVDLNLELGDVFVALGLEAATSLASVARDVGKLDGSTLRRRLVRHASGVWALGQEGMVDDLGDDLAANLRGLLEFLGNHFDYVIVDGLRGFSDHAIAALDAATRVQLVLAQDVMSVRRAARAITIMRRLGIPDPRLQITVSRVTKSSPVTQREIEHSLRLPVVAMFREDAKRVASALDAGALVTQLSGKKGIAQDIVEFAARTDAARKGTANRGQAPARSGGAFRRLRRGGTKS